VRERERERERERKGESAHMFTCTYIEAGKEFEVEGEVGQTFKGKNISSYSTASQFPTSSSLSPPSS
jgi:hypothetical protein